MTNRAVGLLLVVQVLMGCDSGVEPIPAEVPGTYVMVRSAGHTVPCETPSTCADSGRIILAESGHFESHLFIRPLFIPVRFGSFRVSGLGPRFELSFRGRQGPPNFTAVLEGDLLTVEGLIVGAPGHPKEPLEYERQ